MAIRESLEKSWHAEKVMVTAYRAEEGRYDDRIRVFFNGAYGLNPELTLDDARELAHVLDLATMWLVEQENS